MKGVLFNYAKEFEAEIKSIPARFERVGSKKAAFFLIVFSMIFAGFPLAALAWALGTGQYDPRMLYVAIPFPVIGAAVMLYGVNIGVKKTMADIGYDEVRYSYSSLFRTTAWVEPRSAYRGILLREETQGERIYTIIELYHDRSDRRVELAVYLAALVPEAYVRERWEGYSRLFGLPAMRETADGMTVRANEDLALPLRDIPVGEPVPPAAPAAPPKGILLVSSHGVEELLITAKRTLRPGTAAVMAFSAFLAWIGFFSQDDPSVNFLVVGGFGAALFAWINLYTLVDLFTMQSLRFSADRVVLSRKTPFGHTAGKGLYTGRIQDVRIDKGTMQRVDALIIATGESDLQLGHGLPLDMLRWMKDYAVAKIRSS